MKVKQLIEKLLVLNMNNEIGVAGIDADDVVYEISEVNKLIELPEGQLIYVILAPEVYRKKREGRKK